MLSPPLIPAVRHGLAATILPYSAAQREIIDKSIAAHALDNNLSRELTLCASASLVPTPAVERVIALCKQEIKNLVTSKTWRRCVTLY